MEKFILFFLGVVGSWTAFCATDDGAAESIPVALKPFYRVVGYDVALVRAHKLSPAEKPFSVHAESTKRSVRDQGICCFYFNIMKDGQSVGALNTQWIPDPAAYFGELYYGTTPMLRIANISIGHGLGDGVVLGTFDKNNLQRHGYGTQAMESLFVALRKSDFPKDARICLECPTYADHLSKWYASFGFGDIYTPQEIRDVSVKYMAVTLGKVKFPLHTKHKAAAKV